MSLPSESSSHTCAHCSKDAALICKGCKDLPDGNTSSGLITVRYCSGECQKNDWDRHKPFCKKAQLRQKVYRAGNIAQQVFYLFSRTTNMLAIDRIDKAGETWVLHSPKKYEGKSQLIPFPPSCAQSEEEQKALLSHQKGNISLSFLHGLLRALFQNLCTELSEIHFHTKNRQVFLRLIYPTGMLDTTDRQNAVLKLKLRNREEYALDMAGAQFGWPEAILPWDAYSASRIRFITATSGFGQARRDVRDAAMSIEPQPQRKWMHEIQAGFRDLLDVTISDYLAVRTGFNTLLALPNSEFETQRSEFVNLIQERLEAYKNFSEERGIFRVENMEPFSPSDEFIAMVNGTKT